MAPQFRLGVLAFANLPIPEDSAFAGERHMRDLFGEPLEDEHYNASGDSEQRTRNGLLVWRKADNWTAFTNGWRTWVNGPNGVQDRLNSERFPWEADGYRPVVYSNPLPAQCIQGEIKWTPAGVVLHGSRSGRRQSLYAEFHGTRGYAQSGPSYLDDGERIYLGWHASGGEDAVALHMPVDQWAYHGGDSRRYLGYEFPQPTEDYEITDAAVRAFCWWFREVARKRWPEIPADFPCHSETLQGKAIGKSDVFSLGSRKNDQLRRRILAAL